MFLAIAVGLLISFSTSAQTTKVVTDSVTFYPQNVEIFEGLTKAGNPKYWIELPTGSGKVKKVSLTESHVMSRRLLALIERRDEEGRYYYSVKFAEPKKSTSEKADLSALK